MMITSAGILTGFHHALLYLFHMEKVQLAELDMLSAFTEATQEADAFESHPMAEHNMEEQLLYLQGLAMVMNVDNDIHETELEYLRILIKSFGLDESITDDCVKFAQAPDKDSIQAFVRCFRCKPIAQLFLFDALMMTRRDGAVHDKEVVLVNAMAGQLEILKGTQQDIFDLFCHIKNRNWQESALYFSSHLLNPEHFKHLLAYHEIDLDELMTETTTIRTSRLQEVVSQKVGLSIIGLTWRKLKTEPIYALYYKSEEIKSGHFSEIFNTLLRNLQSVEITDAKAIRKGKTLFTFSNETIVTSPVLMKVLKVSVSQGQTISNEVKLATFTLANPEDFNTINIEKNLIAKKTEHVFIDGGLESEDDLSAFMQPDIMIPFLQYILDRRQVRVSDGVVYKTSDNKELEYCQLMNLGIEFDQESNAFSIGNQALKATDNYLPVDLLNDFFSLMYH
jgi:uncharacterized tellurite resistance protein B-like protein